MKYTKLINWFKYSTLGHRLVYMAGNSGHESAESPENPSEIKVTKIEDLNGKESSFDSTDPDKTLKELANGDVSMKNNLITSIKETLKKAEYKTGDNDAAFKSFWETMGANGCKKVRISDGKIQFLDDTDRLMNPRKSKVSIVFDISKLEPTGTPQTQQKAKGPTLTEQPLIINGKTVDPNKPKAEPQKNNPEEEKSPSFGTADLRTLEENGLNDMTKIATAILTLPQSKLEQMGFNIGDAKALRTIQNQKISPERYAKMLEANKSGATLNLIIALRDISDKIADTQKTTLERRYNENFKLTTKEQQLYANYESAISNHKEDLMEINSGLIKMAENETTWNRIWDNQGEITLHGKEYLVNLWKRMPPYNRSENELRDLTRKFLTDIGSHNGFLGLGSRKGANVNLFIEKFNIQFKGESATGEQLLEKKKELDQKYSQIPQAALNIYENPETEIQIDKILQKREANKLKYEKDKHVATSAELLEGISQEEINLLLAYNNPNGSWQVIKDRRELNNVLQTSVLMLSAISNIRSTPTIKETPQERELTVTEQRLNQYFNHQDRTTLTQSDLATEAKEGKTIKWELLGINFVNNVPDFMHKYSSEQSAYLRIFDQCKDGKGQLDAKKLVSRLNDLIYIGARSLMMDGKIDQPELFQTFGIDEKEPIQSKLDKLTKALIFDTKTPERALTEQTLGEKAESYRKAIIQIGYVVDSKITEGNDNIATRTPEQNKNLQETLEHLSDNVVIRNIQLEAIKKGYPADKIGQIDQRMREGIKSRMGAGIAVDLGGDGKGMGAGGGFGVDLGNGYYGAIGAGYFKGQWQMVPAVATTADLGNNLTGAVGGGLIVPLSGDNKFIPRPQFSAGLEQTFPVDGSNFDFFLAVGANLDVKSITDLAKNTLGGGAMIGVKWNPDKALDSATKEKIAQEGYKEIATALDQNDNEKAARLIEGHPGIGPFVSFMKSNYNWRTTDIVNFYKEQENAVRNSAVEDMRPVITTVGVGALATIGSNGPNLGLGLMIGFAVQKSLTIYRAESRDQKSLINEADAKADASIVKQLEDLRKQFGYDNIKFSSFNRIHEESRFVHDNDGQRAINVQRQTIEFQKATGEALKTLEYYNKKLSAIGISLSPAEDGLLQVNIDTINNPSDPTYNIRSTRLYMDPSMTGKGLTFKNGKVYLATTANPDIIFRRVDYSTPFPDHEGASRHTVIAITDLPQRSTEDIMKHSGFFIAKSPNKAMELAYTGIQEEQSNIQDSTGFARYRDRFDRYKEAPKRDWSEYTNRLQEREKEFQHYEEQLVRPGLTPENSRDLTENCFAKKFYEKHHYYYKQITTEKAGKDVDLTPLIRMIEKEYKKENPDQPELSEVEKHQILTDLTIRSWASIDNKTPEQREKTFQQRLTWAEEKLLPIWKAKAEKLTPPIPQEDVKRLLHTVISELRDTDINDESEKTEIPKQNITFTLAGTENIVGLRANIEAEALYGVDKYAQYLGQNNDMGKIARLIFESISPIPEENTEFLRSPLALKLFSKRALIIAFGPEKFARITQIYNALNNKQDISVWLNNNPTLSAVLDEFKSLAKQIRELQLNPTKGNSIQLPNNCYLQIKPVVASAGANQDCANFSITAFEDFDVIVPPDMQTSLGFMGAEGESHSTVTPEQNASYFNVGLGVVGTVATSQNHRQNTPPGKTPPSPNAEPNARGSVGQADGKIGDITRPETPHLPTNGSTDTGTPTSGL